MTAQVVGFPPSMWEICIECLAPGPSQPWPLQAFEGWTSRWEIYLATSVSLLFK